MESPRGGLVRLSLASALDFYGVRYRPGRYEQKVLCVIHADSDPSMNVSLDKNVFKCHACGAGGSALTLLMEMEGLDVQGALQFAKDHGIESVEGEAEETPTLGAKVRRKRKRGKAEWHPPWG